MVVNIYEKIKKENGFLAAMAPMEGVTDSVFRQMISSLGYQPLFFTEFLNVDGFCSKGREKVSHRIRFSKKEKPIVIQLWGNSPELYVKSLEEILKLNPTGIDINMGCSVHDVLSGGRGSALIKDKPLAKEIIDAVKSSSKGLPVSVKTRIGYDSPDIDGWIGFLLEQGLDMITIHGRTSKQGYTTPSDWEMIRKCVEIRDEISPKTIILGNGDVKSMEDGKNKVSKYSVDGFMIGREILANPWAFTNREQVPLKDRVDKLIKHMQLYEKTWGDTKPFNSQKKYIKAYINNFEGANELRKKLLECQNTHELYTILSEYR